MKDSISAKERFVYSTLPDERLLFIVDKLLVSDIFSDVWSVVNVDNQ